MYSTQPKRAHVVVHVPPTTSLSAFLYVDGGNVVDLESDENDNKKSFVSHAAPVFAVIMTYMKHLNSRRKTVQFRERMGCVFSCLNEIRAHTIHF